MAEPPLPPSGRILVIEDDLVQARALLAILNHEGFAVESASTAAQGLRRATGVPPTDLVILDVMLPDMSGVELARRLRACTEVPIILLTSRQQEVDKVVGLDAGADDYITKPFSAAELLARIRALLRRRRPAAHGPQGGPDVLHVGSLTIDLGTHEVRRADQKIPLTVREFDVLRVLAEAHGRVMARKLILAAVWGQDFFGDDRMLDTYVRRLRKKLEVDSEHPRYVQTVRGVGYRLIEASE